MKDIEMKSQSSASAGMTSLRTKLRKAELTISALKNDLSLQSTKISCNKKLELDLKDAQKKNGTSQSKITHLEGALPDI